jgi:hypothetical protein
MPRRAVPLCLIKLYLIPKKSKQKRGGNEVKKQLILSVCVLLVLCVFTALGQAAGDQKILVYVDGKKVAFPDQQPYIDSNNRTMVPVRFVSETLGAKVDWNSKAKEVSVKDEAKQKDIKLWVNKKNYTLNGETKTMDTSAVLTKQARVMVPLRFVSEGLGAVVKWEVILGNGVVHNFTLGQSEAEIQAIMEQIRKEIQGETESGLVDVEKTGTLMKEKTWVVDPDSMAKSIMDRRNIKISFITADDLKNNDYKLSESCTILDLSIDKDYIYVKEKGSGSPAAMFLAEENNLNRFRDARYHTYTPGTFEAEYDIIDDYRDQHIPMSTCDIAKVTHIYLMHGDGCIAIENPMYKGGK